MAKLPETTRNARILNIVWQISNAPLYWTRAKLAEQHEVSERTITKDLDIIRHGLRFDLRHASRQGYYFATLPQLPAVSYTLPEALALVLAAHSARQLSGVPHAELSAAIARLSSVMPEELRSIVERFAGEAEPLPEHAHRERMLELFSRAISLNRPLEVIYAAGSSGGEETRRRVDPYEVMPYGRSWHMVGYCHLRQSVRTFKVDRVRSAELLTTTFTRDETFDLAAYLNEGWGLMRGLGLPVERVELLFHPPAARWVAEERWHALQELEWQPDGTLLFAVNIQVTPEFQRWVFRYGRSVEVLAPDSLRAWVRAEAEAILAAVNVG